MQEIFYAIQSLGFNNYIDKFLFLSKRKNMSISLKECKYYLFSIFWGIFCKQKYPLTRCVIIYFLIFVHLI